VLVSQFINRQLKDRQRLLTGIHKIILKEDKAVKAKIKPMMGKEMIVYHAPGAFKYGLASAKNYMSLHVMPIYGSASLYSKYKALLPRANFQKGCINFKIEEEMPLDIVRQLIQDCSKIDLLAIKESHLESKKDKLKSLTKPLHILPVLPKPNSLCR